MYRKSESRKTLLLIILTVLTCPTIAQDFTESSSPKSNEPFSLDMDGIYAIVGSPGNETDQNQDNEIDRAGAAFIYRQNSNGGWDLMQKIVASDRGNQDQFGYDVGISSEGYAVVGTRTEDAAYFFELNDNNWEEIQKIEGPAFQSFGESVAMHQDKALIGDPGEDDFVGAAYLYQRDGNTGQWVEVRQIIPPSSEQQSFGRALDISNQYIVVGAPDLDASLTEPNVGAVYAFSAGDGTPAGVLSFPNLEPGDRMGTTVAISGGTAIVGIPEHPLDENGADDQNAQNDGLLHPGIVSIFTAPGWDLQKIVSPDRDPNDQFGIWVDIQGTTAIAGANQEGLDADGGDFKAFAGLGYILEQSGNVWSVVDRIDASDRDPFDEFGLRVAIGDFGACVIGDDKTYFYNRCIESEITDLTADSNSVCEGESTLLRVTGDLAGGQVWRWYEGGCDGTSLGSGDVLEVNPNSTTTYFVKAEGGSCGSDDTCSEITIAVNALPQIEALLTGELMGNDGAIDLTIQGGNPPYTFDWDTDERDDFDDPEDLSGLTAGTYQVIVMDNNGCVSTLDIILESEAVTGLSPDPDNSQLQVYPNPNIDGIVNVSVPANSDASLNIRDISGKLLLQYSLSDKKELDLSALKNGTYLLEFFLEDERLIRRWVKR